MAPPNPLTRYADAERALEQASRLPIGSAGRTDLLAVAQINATLAAIDAIGYAMTPRRIVLPADASLSPDTLLVPAGPVVALPDDENVLGLTHPPTTRKRAQRVKTPKPSLGKVADAVAAEFDFPGAE